MTSPPSNSPPVIFAPARRIALRRRMRALQMQADAARFITDDMVEDVVDRLAFLRHQPANALVVGDVTGALSAALRAQGVAVTRADPAPGFDAIAIDEEQPLPFGQGFDLVVSLGTLDTVNDLPGALIHLRRAMAPGGLAIIAIPGAGSLPAMRAIMLAADGDRPAPRLHPQIDVRAGGQLLQRAGFADPVVDSHSLRASYRTLGKLVGDLRAQGLSACLARGGAPLSKAALARAETAFAELAEEGRVTETFEILTLSGWAKALKPPKF
ncbi:class I SAM-dependent methyltransferase [Novosphingobium sp.]|uniref:class I SAM-dependent methyltransferase n=1 Tax=Novosphingobium sp. TaxID=1874826 RepID=UPI003B52BBCC